MARFTLQSFRFMLELFPGDGRVIWEALDTNPQFLARLNTLELRDQWINIGSFYGLQSSIGNGRVAA